MLRKKYKTDIIEIALTKLDSDIADARQKSGANANRELRRQIEKELGEYFAKFAASEELLGKTSWLTQFIDQAFSPGDVVVSLNYDCVLEGALDCRGKWSPVGGYGCLFNEPRFANEGYSKSPITVLKIHGSASFKAAPDFVQPEVNPVSIVLNEHFFPHSCKNKTFNYGGQTGYTYLIAPSYVKVPAVEISYLMLDALRATAVAEKLIVIGSGLRPEDGFLTLMLTNFLHQPSWQKRRVVIVGPSAGDIGDRVKKFWGVNVSKQIALIEGSLQKSVPALLKSISKHKGRSTRLCARLRRGKGRGSQGVGS